MKGTIIMLAVIATIIATWLFFGCIAWYMTATMSFRDILKSDAVLSVTLFIGWIPTVVVGLDLDEKLE